MACEFTVSRACVLTLAVVVGANVTGSAQAVHSIRYDPPEALRVQIISRSQISMTVSVAGEAAAAVTAEARRLEGVTQRVLSVDGGRYAVRVTFDSVRTRMRPEGGSWRSIAPAAREVAVARVVVDDRLGVIADAEFVDVPNVNVTNSEVMRGLTAGFQFELPQRAVSVGEQWAGELRYPLISLASLGRETGAPAGGEIVATSTFTLDSVITRPTDTLSYMTVRGRFTPATVGGEGRTAQASMGGSVVASLIWSSGWHGFVAGASKVLITMIVRQTPGDVASAQNVEFDVNSSFQVRR